MGSFVNLRDCNDHSRGCSLRKMINHEDTRTQKWPFEEIAVHRDDTRISPRTCIFSRSSLLRTATFTNADFREQVFSQIIFIISILTNKHLPEWSLQPNIFVKITVYEDARFRRFLFSKMLVHNSWRWLWAKTAKLLVFKDARLQKCSFAKMLVCKDVRSRGCSFVRSQRWSIAKIFREDHSRRSSRRLSFFLLARSDAHLSVKVAHSTEEQASSIS